MSLPLAIFVTPWISDETEQLILKIVSMVDVRLGIVTARSASKLEKSTACLLVADCRISDVTNTSALTASIIKIRDRHGPIASIVAEAEELQIPVAAVRGRLNIRGMTPQVIRNFRDKARMKKLLSNHGLPTARFSLVSSEPAVRRFAARVGYPIVLKPRAGVRAVNTFRIDDERGIARALKRINPRRGAEALAEEFIDGDEYSCDTISVDRQMLWHSITRYAPTPLEANRDLNVQWRAIIPREFNERRYFGLRSAVADALSILGMETGYAHFEWFLKRDGAFVLSEVAARPPGAKIDCLLSAAHDFDFAKMWFRLMIFGVCELPPVRRFSSGVVFLRAPMRGKIKALLGLDEMLKELGSMCFEKELPEIGERAVLDYEGNGSLVIRHPETEIVDRALSKIADSVRLEVRRFGRKSKH